jgi:hypothetical protein
VERGTAESGVDWCSVAEQMLPKVRQRDGSRIPELKFGSALPLADCLLAGQLDVGTGGCAEPGDEAG